VDLLPVSDGRRIGETVLRKGAEALHLGGVRYVLVTDEQAGGGGAVCVVGCWPRSM
jgi:hypothetical protein